MSIFDNKQGSALNYIQNNFDLKQIILALQSPAVENLKKALQNTRNNTVVLTRKQATELIRLATKLYDDRAQVDTRLLNETAPAAHTAAASITTIDSSKMSHMINKQIAEIESMLNRVHVNSPYRERLKLLTDDLSRVYTEKKLIEFFQLYKEYIQDEDKRIQNLNKIFDKIKNINVDQKEGNENDSVIIKEHVTFDKTKVNESQNKSGELIETVTQNIILDQIPNGTQNTDQIPNSQITKSAIDSTAPPLPPPPPPPPSLLLSESTTTTVNKPEKKSAASQLPPPTVSIRDQLMEQLKQGVKLKPVVDKNQQQEKKEPDLIETVNPNVVSKENYQLQGTTYVKTNSIRLKDVLDQRMKTHRMNESETETTQSENDEINDFDDNFNVTLKTKRNNSRMKKCLSSILFLVRNEESLRNDQNINEVSDINKLLNAETATSLQSANEILKTWQKKTTR
ncbi:hypothetical protein KM620_gp002 [Hyposidra talaca nucleopolyhedrovirus]|uniref:WH2 domain-containing protein n=1 Tax=Hyposidra talaca nucleopolyhedrovirus TaxID=1070315 RepID=A0A2Z4HHU0_9ABAC|nr:hypothetical protein KM620_gp002 [Hyposidra talaca nucleopolyhedrovirus]AWW14362.1 hypothetical protein HytaNPV_gp002 [Hyposidra talaca nucleopolyhedrovirus]